MRGSCWMFARSDQLSVVLGRTSSPRSGMDGLRMWSGRESPFAKSSSQSGHPANREPSGSRPPVLASWQCTFDSIFLLGLENTEPSCDPGGLWWVAWSPVCRHVDLANTRR